MKSIKPGRGTSAQGVAGGVIAIVVGIGWMLFTSSMLSDFPFEGVGTFFPLFGLLFVGIGIFNVIFHYKNVTSKDRMSIIDIVDSKEESDPLHDRYGHRRQDTSAHHTNDQQDMSNPYSSEQSNWSDSSPPKTNTSARKFEGDYCPYCGTRVEMDFHFCPKCGKDI